MYNKKQMCFVGRAFVLGTLGRSRGVMALLPRTDFRPPTALFDFQKSRQKIRLCGFFGQTAPMGAINTSLPRIGPASLFGCDAYYSSADV